MSKWADLANKKWDDLKDTTWREVRLGEYIETLKGNAFKSSIYKNIGIPVVRASNFTQESIEKDNIVYIDYDKSYERFILNKRDVLCQTVGSWLNNPNSLVGKVVRVPHYLDGAYLNQNIVKIIPIEGLNNDFLFYRLKVEDYKHYCVDNAQGAANQASITLKTIRRFNFTLPNLEIQEKIADVLSTYDELIENNNRRIEILEKTAEEIYKEWFVRMRFPGYENTRFIKGIPEGWEVKRVGDLGRIETGKTPSTNRKDYYDGNIMFVKTPDMHNNLFTLNTEIYLSKEGSDSQPKKLLPKNSIMVSCIGTGGVVSINGELAHTNQQINSIILKDLKLREWTYFTLKSMKKTIELFGATGATMTNLSKGKFQNLKVLYPTDELIIKFNNINKDIFEEIKNLIFQNQNLIKQRDLLLPRLMNGTIEVK